MFNILEILEDLVTSKIISNDHSTTSDESFEEWLILGRSEQEKIKKKLFELVFNVSCEEHICLFFNHYQTRLINSSNLLYDHIDADARFLTLPQVKAEVSQYTKISFLHLIDDLLSHSQNQFSKYLNPVCIIPYKLRDIAIKQFDCVLSDFNNFSTWLPGKLIEIISEPVKKFISNPQFATYSNLNYLTRFTSEILGINAHAEENLLVSSLKIKLFYLNYNSLSFFNFITDEINEAVTKIDTTCGKVEKLSWFLKDINQMPLKPGLAYNQSQKSIHDLVSQWIIEEICYLEKSIQLSAVQNKDSKNMLNSDFKLVTDLSVPQLAYFLKILVKTGILKNQNDRELIKFIAAYTRSKKAETISPESLRVKYYSNEENVRDEIKEVIIKLLNYINKSKPS